MGLQSPAPGVSKVGPVCPIRVLHLPGYSEVYFFKLKFTSGSLAALLGKERFTFHWDCCWGTKPTQKEVSGGWKDNFLMISLSLWDPLPGLLWTVVSVIWNNKLLFFHKLVTTERLLTDTDRSPGLQVGPRGLRWSKAGVGVGVN